MKRGLRLGVLIAALVLPGAGIAAQVDDAHGMSCLDFQVVADYTTNAAGEAVLLLTVGTESGEPSCADAAYVVTVRNSAGNVVATTTFVGDGTTGVFQRSLTIAGNPSPITVTVQSFKKGNKNPFDTGTASLILDGGTGATSFR